MPPLNQKDREILFHLRQNSRTPLTAISKKTSIPISTIFDRLKTNANKAIYKHTALLNYSKLGFKAQVNILIRVQNEDKTALREYLLKHPAINSAYTTDGHYDFLVEAIFRDAKYLEQFIIGLKRQFRVIETDTSMILEDLKRESFMPTDSPASI